MCKKHQTFLRILCCLIIVFLIALIFKILSPFSDHEACWSKLDHVGILTGIVEIFIVIATWVVAWSIKLELSSKLIDWKSNPTKNSTGTKSVALSIGVGKRNIVDVMNYIKRYAEVDPKSFGDRASVFDENRIKRYQEINEWPASDLKNAELLDEMSGLNVANGIVRGELKEYSRNDFEINGGEFPIRVYRCHWKKEDEFAGHYIAVEACPMDNREQILQQGFRGVEETVENLCGYLKSNGVQEIHLFYAGPLPLAFTLQHVLGRDFIVCTYHYNSPEYLLTDRLFPQVEGGDINE